MPLAISPLQMGTPVETTLGTALLSAAVYSALWYARAYAKDGEVFKPRKFIATLIVGLGVAFAAWSADVTLTEQGFFARMAVYVGLISIVEAVLKAVYAEWFRVTGGTGGLRDARMGRGR